jgi:hypothetical protein
MRIRAEQIRFLGELSGRQFEQRMAAHLRDRFPSQTAAVSDDALLGRIRSGAQKAKCYGLETETQTCTYLEFDVIYGGDFDENAQTGWAGTILRNHRLSGDEKLQALEDHELFAERAGA